VLANTNTHAHTYTYTCTHAHAHMHTCTHTHTYTHTHINTHTHLCLHPPTHRFQEWPDEALKSVAMSFYSDVELSSDAHPRLLEVSKV